MKCQVAMWLKVLCACFNFWITLPWDSYEMSSGYATANSAEAGAKVVGYNEISVAMSSSFYALHNGFDALACLLWIIYFCLWERKPHCGIFTWVLWVTLDTPLLYAHGDLELQDILGHSATQSTSICKKIQCPACSINSFKLPGFSIK